MADLEYLLACVEAHADKLPVPSHMRELVARVRLAALPKGEPTWTDEAKALHWIDRYATGIDDEPQMSRILACVGFAAPPAGDER